MDELEAIERIAVQARKEAPPPVGVSGGVLRRIQMPRRSNVLPLSLFAAASAAAASVALAVGVYSWMKASDPMAQLFAPVQVGLLW